LTGQSPLARRFLCPGCAASEGRHTARARAGDELAVARAMLEAVPRLRHAERVRAQPAAAGQALAVGDDGRAGAALAAAIERLRPLPR
jgi:hypothetical protein